MLEAFTTSPQDILLGNHAILKGQGPRIRGFPAHLLVWVANNIAGSPVGHDNIGNLMLKTTLLTGDGSDSYTTSHVSTSVGDETFCTVDMPHAITQHGTRSRTARVGACLGFGQTKGP